MTSAPATAASAPRQRLVVFDGLCHVCTGWARFLQRHPSRPAFRLIPMQSETGRQLMAEHGFDPDDPLTFLVLDADRALTESDAALHLMASAGGVWRLVHGARLVPGPLRDRLYRLVARNRYRWFGRRDSCYVPEPAAECASEDSGAAPRQTELHERANRPDRGA